MSTGFDSTCHTIGDIDVDVDDDCRPASSLDRSKNGHVQPLLARNIPSLHRYHSYGDEQAQGQVSFSSTSLYGYKIQGRNNVNKTGGPAQKSSVSHTRKRVTPGQLRCNCHEEAFWGNLSISFSI